MVNTKLYSLYTTTDFALNDSTELVGQTITQQNNPADSNINTATAIVENITKFQRRYC